MKSDAPEVKAYLDGLSDERRAAIAAVRKVVLTNLPKGYEEAIGFGMICYQVPLAVYPDTYNGLPLMYAALASQKTHMALYLMCAYGSPAMTNQLREGFRLAGKRLDMGKSCVRFRRLADLPLDVIGRAIAAVPMKEFVESVTEVHEKPAAKKPAAKKPAAKKTVGKKTAARKPAAKSKAATKKPATKQRAR